MTISTESDFQTENWTEDEIEIFRKFRFRCISCDEKAVVLHELVPKSKLKDWKREGNRVPLCAVCHEAAHKTGTNNSRKWLTEMRDMRLELYAN